MGKGGKGFPKVKKMKTNHKSEIPVEPREGSKKCHFRSLSLVSKRMGVAGVEVGGSL